MTTEEYGILGGGNENVLNEYSKKQSNQLYLKGKFYDTWDISKMLKMMGGGSILDAFCKYFFQE